MPLATTALAVTKIPPLYARPSLWYQSFTELLTQWFPRQWLFRQKSWGYEESPKRGREKIHWATLCHHLPKHHSTQLPEHSLHVSCPPNIFTLSFKCINFLPRPWSTACYISQNLEIKLIHFRILFFFFILLLCECCLEGSPFMFFPSLHHKIQFQSVNSVHVCFTRILLNIQNRNHSLNSSPTLLPHYKTDSFSGFVVEMSQHFVYQQYDKIQQKSIDSHSHFPNKF